MYKIFNINKLLVITGSIGLILLVVFWFWWGDRELNIDNVDLGKRVLADEPIKGISGIDCDNKDKRPVAVMVSSDLQTRPLSGIGSADIVFEMPVTPGGVTRMMAVYQCSEPKEVGSIRSAREDFIPLALQLGAVYVHWGGEKKALVQLDSHIIDNIDAMKYEEKYFYRKTNLRPPHNGFTDFSRIAGAINDLKYINENKFIGYPHAVVKVSPSIINSKNIIKIDYPEPFNVEWTYNLDKNTYRRYRDGKPEIDKNYNSQIEASVVINMETSSEFSNKDYLTVHTSGSGRAYVYQNGIEIQGRWEKDPSRLDSKLSFLDTDNKEIIFVPGSIWVEITMN